MAVTVRATDDGDGDWGDAALADIEAVASSAARCFSVVGDEESVAITLLAMTKGPMTVQDPSLLAGEAVVWLGTQGTVWAQVAFQFAHEFCHVIADPKTMPWDRFLWIEEAICETASLFALRCMAKTWAVAPPHPNWQDYSVKLEEYVSGRMSEPEHCLPPGAQFHAWLADHLPLLEEDSGRREDNTVIAKELLPIFEGDPAAWRAIRHLHSWPRAPTATLADFFEGWAIACPGEYRHGADAVGQLLNAESAA